MFTLEKHVSKHLSPPTAVYTKGIKVQVRDLDDRKRDNEEAYQPGVLTQYDVGV